MGSFSWLGSRPAARVVAVLLALAVTADCGGKVPERGTPQWIEGMRQREIYVSANDVPGTGLKITSASGLTQVPAAAVWEAFLDIGTLHTFLYRVIESKVIEDSRDRMVFRIAVNAPPIALTGGYDTISITAEMTKTRSDDGRKWRGDFHSVEGNVRRAFGSFEVEDLGGDGTLVTFSMFIDFGKVYIPDDVANFFVRDFLATWGENFRGHVEDPAVRIQLERAAATRAGRDPNEVAPSLEGIGDFMR